MSKQYLDLSGLTTYDGKIKEYIGTEDAKKIDKISEAAGSKVVVSTAAGQVSESDLAISNVADKDYADSAASTAAGEVAADLEELDQSLAAVAKSGDAADVAYDNTTSGLTADDVQDALDELAEASAGGVASKTVYITETAGGAQDAYSKRYGIYQGATGSSSSPVVAEKLGDIDIPKDMVVESGSVVNITFDPTNNHLYDGDVDVTEVIKGAGGTATVDDAGKYIKLQIANATSDTLYIKATDLVDIYTTEQHATEVQLTIDANNVISAYIPDNAIRTDAIINSAVTTAKIADDAVTAAKVNIAAHTEAQTAGTDGLALSVTTTDGQVSAVSGSIAANTYEAYGAVDAAIADLDATESQTAGADGLALSITETDGVITSISGSIAANTYEPYGIGSIATADINALFS